MRINIGLFNTEALDHIQAYFIAEPNADVFITILFWILEGASTRGALSRRLWAILAGGRGTVA